MKFIKTLFFIIHFNNYQVVKVKKKKIIIDIILIFITKHDLFSPLSVFFFKLKITRLIFKSTAATYNEIFINYNAKSQSLLIPSAGNNVSLRITLTDRLSDTSQSLVRRLESLRSLELQCNLQLNLYWRTKIISNKFISQSNYNWKQFTNCTSMYHQNLWGSMKIIYLVYCIITLYTIFYWW